MTDAPAPEPPALPRVPILDVLAEWLLYVSAALIVCGLVLPSIHKPGLIRGEDMTVFDVIAALWEAEKTTLAVIVTVFSIAFPLVKTITAAILFRLGSEVSRAAAGFMQFLGKWSMLDVFLAALLVGLTQVSAMLKVEPRMGLYLFAAGVILNNLATARLSFSRAS